MHINYCEQGQTLDEICRKAVSWGYDGVEFRRKRKGVEESTEQYLDNIKESSEKYKLKNIVFGGPGPELMTSDSQKRVLEVEEIKKFYDLAAKRFDLNICNMFSGVLLNPSKKISYSNFSNHGSFIANEKEFEWAAEGFKEIAKVADKYGIRLALETHPCYLHDTLNSTLKLVEMIGSTAVGVNLDYGNIKNLPEVPSVKEMINKLGSKLFYIHFKNSIWLQDGTRVRTGLGEGDINHREIIGILRKINYKGFLCIETTRAGDREWYAEKDIAYIKSVINSTQQND